MRRRKTLVIEYPASMRIYSSDPRAKMTIEKLDNLCKNETLKIIEAILVLVALVTYFWFNWKKNPTLY
jgi:hypothetical protein